MAHLGFEETELRLGLPGDQANRKVSTKREFEETVDLKLELKLQTTSNSQEEKSETVVKPPTPVTKARAVGWPPVRSYRKNVVMKSVQPEKVKKLEPEGGGDGNPGLFVKVSMDGAPYLRKLDLNIYHNYKDLSLALDKLFDSFANNGNGSSMDLKNGFSEYVTTYQDKDGDWMLVGDVPWNMFVESCKRLRLIKGSEATGFAPKSRNRC